MLLFILACYKSIKILGQHSFAQEDPREQFLWWGIAVMMVGHCITFLSVAYFGQIKMLLYMTIAIAAFAKTQMINSHGAMPLRKNAV